MLYKFNINLNDKDYYNFNKFYNFKTHYGRKLLLFYRIFVVVIFIPFILLTLSDCGYNAEGLVMTILYFILMGAMELLLKPMLCLGVKMNMKLKKKSGKAPYTPTAEMVFYDDYFIEQTPQSKSEILYSIIDSLYIDGKGNVYIFVNNIAGFILLKSCFDSEDQYNSFLTFISTKTDIIYNTK